KPPLFWKTPLAILQKLVTLGGCCGQAAFPPVHPPPFAARQRKLNNSKEMEKDRTMQLESAIPRLLPSAELPRYTYVPGSGSPHPIRAPRGHSHNRKQPPPLALDPETWAENRWYLWAIDLFNLGYYWESHEEWERLLRATGADSTCGRFLKGLIKLGAAGVKVREHSLHGVRRHAASTR